MSLFMYNEGSLRLYVFEDAESAFASGCGDRKAAKNAPQNNDARECGCRNTSMHGAQRTIWPVALASINEVNLRRARLVLRWATVSGFNSRCRTFLSICNQPATQGQLSLPSLRGR